MTLKVMADNNQPISASQDGALYNVLANNTDFVIKDIGNEMNITYSTSSLTITLQSGECVLCGRHVTSDGRSSLTLAANDSGYIGIRYDSTNPAFVTLASLSSIIKENINGAGQYHDIALAQYSTNSNGVTSFTDLRRVVSAISDSNKIIIGTDIPSSSIGNDGDIYIRIVG